VDLATFDRLHSPLGEPALAAAAALAPTDATLLACSDRLRKQFPPDLARAALDTALLRRKATAKFTHADRMFFTREALEVASGEVIARCRAERFRRYEAVGDFGCGVGGDAIGLALAGVRVEAVDRDELRTRMAAANLAAYGCGESVRVHVADLLTDPLPDVPAAFADPGRRADGRRFLAVRDYLPPPAELLRRLPAGFPIAFKLAPGVTWADLEAFDGEVEFVSVNGELKECVLWLGELRTANRRATVLAPPAEWGGGAGVSMSAGAPPPPEPRPVAAYLYDPDPAVVRAGLVPTLAEQLGAEPVDAVVQLLTAATLMLTPFATAYRVDEVLPFDPKKVSAALRERNVGRVTVVNRGSLADAERAAARWKLSGADHRFVILTRVSGKQAAVIAERAGPHPGSSTRTTPSATLTG
jgi:hypothetical protein